MPVTHEPPGTLDSKGKPAGGRFASAPSADSQPLDNVESLSPATVLPYSAPVTHITSWAEECDRFFRSPEYQAWVREDNARSEAFKMLSTNVWHHPSDLVEFAQVYGAVGNDGNIEVSSLDISEKKARLKMAEEWVEADKGKIGIYVNGMIDDLRKRHGHRTITLHDQTLDDFFYDYEQLREFHSDPGGYGEARESVGYGMTADSGEFYADYVERNDDFIRAAWVMLCRKPEYRKHHPRLVDAIRVWAGVAALEVHEAQNDAIDTLSQIDKTDVTCWGEHNFQQFAESWRNARNLGKTSCVPTWQQKIAERIIPPAPGNGFSPEAA